jgi:hypothetical protein
LPYPLAQVIAQLPLEHVAVPLVVLQTLLQAPQFAVSVATLASQPVEYLVSQS